MGNYGNVSIRNNDFWSTKRQQAGYRCTDLADKLGINSTNLHLWFTGESKPRDRVHIYRLCKYLEVPYSEGLARFGYEPAVLADTLAVHNVSISEIKKALPNVSSACLNNYLRRQNYPKSSVCNAIADYLGIDRNDFFRELNNERLGSLERPTINTKDENHHDSPSVMLPETINIDPIKNQHDEVSTVSTISTVKWMFNSLYDLLPLSTIIAILDVVKDCPTDEIDWKHALDIVYNTNVLNRLDYDNLISVMRDKGLYA